MGKFLRDQSAYIGLAYLSLFSFGFVDNARGPVFPDLLADFQLSDSNGAWFFFTASAAMLANNVLLFRWMERAGPFAVLRLYSAIQTVGLLIMGLGTSYAIVLLGSAIVGLSLGGLGVSVNVLVGVHAAESHRRRVLSGLHCMYGISSLLAPLLVSVVYQGGFGWRAALGSLSAAPFAVLLVSLTLRTDRSQAASLPLGATALKRPFAPALYFASLCMLYVVAEISISSRLALYVRRDWLASVESSNRLLATYFLGLFAGRLAFALVRFPWTSMQILSASAASGLVCYALGLVHRPAWLALAGVCFSVFYPCAIALINDEKSSGEAGFIVTWCITLQALGLLSMHVLLGVLADAFGLGTALWIGPASLALVLVLLRLKSHFSPSPHSVT